MTLATVFYNPITLPAMAQLWLILPLCAIVALTYKTVRTNDIRRLWSQVLILIGFMYAGLVSLGIVLWLVQDYWP